MNSLTLLTCYLTFISLTSTISTSTVSPSYTDTTTLLKTSSYVSLETHVTHTNLPSASPQLRDNNIDSTSSSWYNSETSLSFSGSSTKVAIKQYVNNTEALQYIFHGLQNASVVLHNILLGALNVTNITIGCENVTAAASIGNLSISTTNSSPSAYSYYSVAPTPENATRVTPTSLIRPTPTCSVTTVFKMTNITYSFDPVHTGGLKFISLTENNPFVIILKKLDLPQEVEDKRPNVTHEGFCRQFSSHLEHEKHFNFSSSFNTTHSVVSLDRCDNDTSVIIFENQKTWYKFPQGPFLYVLEKILYYYGLHTYLTTFTHMLDDHKCKFDVRSKVQYSNGQYYNHYRNRHATSWGVCNNFYQHAHNLTVSDVKPK
uniref:Glycoprotein ORF-O n=1 Tax=Elephant endotheliotropic herpesvirus 1A TaxID=759753 RepID=A0A866VU96_ELHV1|nr:glycoprotein ORF-O [Elephant endotheliotropic herpesvirus 1A]QOE74864.1 glycoprotein ORF-O [Elephant endotheliotropic herpesvirus 1A]